MAKTIKFLIYGALLIPLISAICGGFIALFGGILGFEGFRAFGGMLAGGGAILFFIIMLSPLGNLVSLFVGSPVRERKDEDAVRNLGNGDPPMG